MNSSPLKIVLVTFEFPPQPGGIGTYAFQMAHHLLLLGNSVTVLAHSTGVDSEKAAEFDKNQPYETIRYRTSRNKLGRIWWRTIQTIRAVISRRPQLVFVAYPNAGVLIRILNFWLKTPYVIAGHGSEFLYSAYPIRALVRWMFNGASLVLSNSQYTAQLMLDNGINRHSISIIPLGADDEFYNFDNYDGTVIRYEHGLEDRSIVLTIGNLLERKGHRYVIEAIRDVRKEVPSVLYLIVGEGPQRKMLSELIESHSLHDNVKLVRFVEQERLPEYYAMCDVFVLNSTLDQKGNAEGFGIALIEAGLMKKPVIGTRKCGIEDAIEDGKSGILVPPNNPVATGAAIKRVLLEDGLAEKMGEFGYARAKSGFTWKFVVERTFREICRIIN